MKLKVGVPSSKKLMNRYPSQCCASTVEHGDLETMIINALYIKALIGEKKVLISKLAKGYEVEDIKEIYENIIINIQRWELWK